MTDQFCGGDFANGDAWRDAEAGGIHGEVISWTCDKRRGQSVRYRARFEDKSNREVGLRLQSPLEREF